MEKRKRMVILLTIVVCVVAVLLFIISVKNRNSAQSGKNKPAGLPMENLVQNKNDSKVFNREVFGKIKTIGENTLVVVDDKSPIKKMTKDGAGATFSLRTSNAPSVFFIENGKSQERKLLSDLKIGDVVRVEYDDMTKEVISVNVSIGGVDLRSNGNPERSVLK
jgi:hypothetical protein